MMPALQYLRHGKALCGKVFKRFVETFNYHNDFIANLKGDGDLPISDGLINVDLTDPRHPVIRLNKQKLKDGTACEHLPGLFEPVLSDVDDSTLVSFAYPYFMVGTRLYKCPDAAVSDIPAAKGIYCLVIQLDSPESAGVTRYASLGAAQQQAMLQSQAVKFLFEFGDAGTPIRDFRNMPTIATQEFGP